MKLTTKKILIIIGIILIIGSVGLNLYFGGIRLRDKIYQKGLQDGVNSALTQIKSGIKVNFEDGVIMFVPNQ